MTTAERLTYTIEEAGDVLGISRAQAYLMVKRNVLPVIRLGRRVVVPKAALEKMLANAGQPVASK